MIKIIAIAVQAIAVAGGAFVGISLGGGSGKPSHEAAQSDSGDHGGDHGSDNADKKKKEKKKAKKKKSKKDDKHGGDHGKEGSESTGFMKFSRQFVVPVVSRDNVSALVILDINLELDPSATENAYSREPKVRDAILKTLLQLSNEGAFGPGLLEEENLNDVRARLLVAAQAILTDDVIDVLILNVARQDI